MTFLFAFPFAFFWWEGLKREFEEKGRREGGEGEGVEGEEVEEKKWRGSRVDLGTGTHMVQLEGGWGEKRRGGGLGKMRSNKR